jgi:glutamine amidotransferase
MGNLGSIVNMLAKVGVTGKITADPETIDAADKLILPGVGAFDSGMKNLSGRGLLPVLQEQVLERRKPVLGLCLGMQLMARCSEEGQLRGLGWVDADVIRFRFEGDQAGLKIPHMGWNVLQPCRPHPLMTGLEDENRFYFVHSYHLVCTEPSDVLALTSYGYEFASAFTQGNILGVQFHPEKSHRFGMALLRNFAELVC